LTDINGKSLKNIVKIRNREFNSKDENLRIKEKYVADAERCDIPKTATELIKIEQILNLVR
jgi:hypothetical protein